MGFLGGIYKGIDKYGALGLLPGGEKPLWGMFDKPGDPYPGVTKEVMAGLKDPTGTAAYRAAAEEAAARSAELRAMTGAAYADRGLGQSGWATAAQQQVGMNEQRALSDAIQQIQRDYLAAALGVRGQSLEAQGAREQALGMGFGSVIGAGGSVAGGYLAGAK